jgi:ATP-dependent protease HslVU (ClpYQ) peptidase subunit
MKSIFDNLLKKIKELRENEIEDDELLEGCKEFLKEELKNSTYHERKAFFLIFNRDKKLKQLLSQ